MTIPVMFTGNLWTTEDGRELDPMTDMTIAHLENTIKFIQSPYVLGVYMEVAGVEDMKPQQYFEDHIKPSNLFKRIADAYKMKTGANAPMRALWLDEEGADTL